MRLHIETLKKIVFCHKELKNVYYSSNNGSKFERLSICKSMESLLVRAHFLWLITEPFEDKKRV